MRGHLSEPETAYFLGSLVGAAFDTTQVAISTIMMAAARFPEAQAVVHAELDVVVGRDTRKFLRLSFLGDKSSNVLYSADVRRMDFAHRASGFHPRGTAMEACQSVRSVPVVVLACACESKVYFLSSQVHLAVLPKTSFGYVHPLIRRRRRVEGRHAERLLHSCWSNRVRKPLVGHIQNQIIASDGPPFAGPLRATPMCSQTPKGLTQSDG